jgi:UbiD family decarboxylase
VEKMSFRSFINQLERDNILLKIKKEVSVDYEIANVLNSLDEKPVLFENVKGYNIPIIGGLVSTRELIAKALNVKREDIIHKLYHAIKNPTVPEVLKEGECQEVIERNIDLTKLPIMKFLDRDGGRYITSSVCIIKDPELGRNTCFHRLMLLDKNRFVARIVEDRGTDTALKKSGGELDMAICIGNSAAVLLAAATSLPKGVDELGMANALEKTDLVKCKTIDLEVPKDCEIVLEGRITNEIVTEGPFLDLTSVYDIARPQHIVEIKCITHRKNPMFQTLIAGKKEHSLLMGMPREPTIFYEVNNVCECKNVLITAGGCTWLHAVVQIKKKNPDDGKKALEAAFRGHTSLKHCVVVDDDIDIFNPTEVEWAIATRFQADKNLLVLKYQPSSSLDPSADLSIGKKARTSKMGIDATTPFGKTGKGFKKEDYEKVDVKKYL